MFARAAALNDAEVVKLIKTRFVPYALDNVVNPQLTAGEKEWLRDRGGRASTLGTAVFTAGGQLLAAGQIYDPAVMRKMLTDALSKYQPEKAPRIEKAVDPKDQKLIRRPFKDGLVLFVTNTVREWKDPSWLVPDEGKPWMIKAAQETPGVDRVWAPKDEADALARGEVPAKLKRRLSIHVAYGMGKCGSFGLDDKVKAVDLTLRAGRLTGTFQFASGDRADVLGFVETKEGKVCRFEVIVKGMGTHNPCGGSGPLHVVAKGKKVPVAIAFMLADPKDVLARVPPRFLEP
jgi:hypothetical protein